MGEVMVRVWKWRERSDKRGGVRGSLTGRPADVYTRNLQSLFARRWNNTSARPP